MEVDDHTDQRRSPVSDPGVPVVGRGEPFESFVGREGNRLVGLAYALSGSRSAADDLAQDALLAAYRNWEEVSRLDNPGAWVRRVVANRAVSLIRRRVAEANGLAKLDRPRGRVELGELATDTEWIWREVRRLPKRQTQ